MWPFKSNTQSVQQSTAVAPVHPSILVPAAKGPAPRSVPVVDRKSVV